MNASDGVEDNLKAKPALGLQNVAKHVEMFLQIMAQDETARPKVRQYSDLLGQLMNVIKGFAQRLQEKMAAGNGAPGIDPEVQGKIQSQQILAGAKAENMRDSNAQRTAQNQVRFELEEQRRDRELEAKIRRDATVEVMETAADIRRKGREAIEQENKSPEETE